MITLDGKSTDVNGGLEVPEYEDGGSKTTFENGD